MLCELLHNLVKEINLYKYLSKYGRLFYKRFKWPVEISRGRLSYAEGILKFDGLSGLAGIHRISELDGRISWKGPVLVRVENLRGRIDAASFLKLWDYMPALMHARDKMKLAASGTLRIRGFKGRFSEEEPGNIQFSADVEPEDLSLETSLLPGPTVVERGRFLVDSTRVAVKGCRFSLRGERLLADLDLRHSGFGSWTGTITLSGGVNREIAEWVRVHNWIPDGYFPRYPLELKDFKIVLSNDGHRAVRGNLIWTEGGVRAYLWIQRSRGLTDIKELTLETGDRKAGLCLLIREDAPKAFLLKWSGVLDGGDLDHVLERNDILDGRVSGDLAIAYSEDDSAGSASVNGSIEASGLNWQWGTADAVYFEKLKIASQKNQAWVDALFRIGADELKANGLVVLSKGRMEADLDMHSDRLSYSTIRLLSENRAGRGIGYAGGGAMPDAGSAKNAFPPWNLRVLVDVYFDFARMEYDPDQALQENRDDKGHPPVIINNAYGILRLEDGTTNYIEVYSQDVCGLDMHFLYERRGKGSRNSLVFRAVPDRQLVFERFLPCIGFRQDIISGPFTLELKLDGRQGPLIMGNGSLRLSARDGNIKKYAGSK